MAECVFAAIYAMRDPKGKTVADMFPMLFEEEDSDEPQITEDDVAMLQAEMAAMNTENEKEE